MMDVQLINDGPVTLIIESPGGGSSSGGGGGGGGGGEEQVGEEADTR